MPWSRRSEGDPAYGPVDDQLAHDPAFISLLWAPGHYEDFMLESTFGNPHEDENGTFDFGIEFLINGDYTNPRRMYLVVDDAGSWMAAVGTDDQWSDATEFPLDDGRFRRLNDEPREEDQLTMAVDGAELHFAINGEYVTSLGVPQIGPGGLAIGTGFDTENALDDAIFPVTDLTVWELQVGLVASRQVRAVPFCYDDGMRTVRRTFCVTTRNRTCPAA